MATCVFCSMQRDTDIEVLAEDEHGFVVEPLEKSAEVHLLVVSRRHVESADSVTSQDAELWVALLALAKRAIREAGVDVDGTGYQIVTNAGRHGVRLYPHLHVHVLGGTPFAL